MTETNLPPIDTKISYNTDKRVPRNFFLHFYNVPLDATVRVVCCGEDQPISPNTHGYVSARFWVGADSTVEATITHQGKPLLTGKYLIHEDDIFLGAFNQPRRLLQVTRGIFGDGG